MLLCVRTELRGVPSAPQLPEAAAPQGQRSHLCQRNCPERPGRGSRHRPARFGAPLTDSGDPRPAAPTAASTTPFLLDPSAGGRLWHLGGVQDPGWETRCPQCPNRRLRQPPSPLQSRFPGSKGGGPCCNRVLSIPGKSTLGNPWKEMSKLRRIIQESSCNQKQRRFAASPRHSSPC